MYSILGWRNRNDPSKRLYDLDGNVGTNITDEVEDVDRMDKVALCIGCAADVWSLLTALSAISGAMVALGGDPEWLSGISGQQALPGCFSSSSRGISVQMFRRRRNQTACISVVHSNIF